jgi:hypothetical protein
MAQTNVFDTAGPITRKVIAAKNEAVSVAGTGNTTLLHVPCAGLERIFVQFSVTTQALDAFLIQAKASADATLTTLYSAAADFTAPTGLLVGASGDLTTTAAAASGWFILDVRGLFEVKVLASAALDSAAVSVYMGGQ